jgi:oligopeptide transport system substrate-binding protein
MLCPEVNMKKIISLMLCLLMCVSVLASCDSLTEDEKGANVRVYLTDYPYTLDPAVVQLNSDVEQILSLIFEPLTTIDEDGNVKPCLATEWYYDYDEIYQLHKMYFELKETKWSDNRNVTADDVIYAWRRILSPEMDSPYASLLFGIKGARDVKSGVGTIDDLGLAAVDDTLLEVTFEKEYDYDLFAEQVANIHLAPSREDIVTRYEKTNEDWA